MYTYIKKSNKDFWLLKCLQQTKKHFNMTKVISISDDAYEELSKLKNGSSFTEIIIELTKEKKKKSIMDFAGILTDKEAELMKKEIKEGRKWKFRRFE